jgi:putative methionine-R-sulfoxide reductase with GAF domain
MDHYSIIESPSAQPKDNGVVPEENAVENGPSAASPSLTPNAAPDSLPAPPENGLLSLNSPAPPVPEAQPLAQSSAADLDTVLQAIVQRAQYISNANGAAIALRQGGEVVCRAASGSSAPDRGARLEIKTGLTAECLRSGEMMRCDNVALDPRVNLESCKRLGIESIIIMPIRRGERLEGVLELFSAAAYSFQERDVEMVRTLADEVGKQLAEAEQPPSLPVEPSPLAPPLEQGLSRCEGCGATLSQEAVFCTECGAFQEGKLAKRKKWAPEWNARIAGRRLIVPAAFVALALAVAVVPGPRSSVTAPRNGPAPQAQPPVAAQLVRPSAPAPATNPAAAPANSANSSVPPATNPKIAKSVKQLLGGVSSDFSKLLPVNEKAEPPSNGDPNLKVWVDTRKGFYYCPGDEQYGRTDKGAFMTQKQAESNYYIPALIKPCM